ncbi:hypothetical protein CONLIGDRAFT_216695 [Coniochaeta ligniaria NRRL 30616]|uniref:Zn(2)-C6 fungal-type domain-containing protein n=1 Tax=Coniochaeta ligniaria NRRL 30616 TaxID=1408157 RepID=A0A1J7I4N6_9PEZI|nr:hypothetical protein CONLIGDRAFT_216695 [Coniochaeta ligniaria NRRL 30616]
MDQRRAGNHRVANACDICKARKVKCDGANPCAYCARRQRPEQCSYSAQRRRRHQLSVSGNAGAGAQARASADSVAESVIQHTQPQLGSSTSVVTDTASSTAVEEHDETEVPREARLLWDSQGKLIFIGDCAPLSFFQTVRQLVTSAVDADAFSPQTSRYSVLENAYPKASAYPATRTDDSPKVDANNIQLSVLAYFSVTAGLVDLFDDSRLVGDICLWAAQNQGHDGPDNMTSAIYYLVLAIGQLKQDQQLSQAYFDFARDRALANIGGNMSIATVQAFLLITLYTLGASQINGAFLFFGLAVRAAYSIGVHRTEVNSRFGPEMHRQRDRLWKSLRAVDLFLSTSMGRPPATSDVDCTVSYRATNEDGQETFDLLNASVQIFLIMETIVVEVYSRRKISLRLTEGISHDLREWSARWLPRLRAAVADTALTENAPDVNGACKVMSTYYYAVILVSRPFLMHELHRRLSLKSQPAVSTPSGLASAKARLADACIDAASLMVDPIHGLIERGLMAQRAPVVVSWLFAASLVLGLGLIGGFGRIIEKHCRLSITALEYFAETDTHAMQYSLIAKSLLATALEHLDKKEAEERLKSTESSSQLFGLLPHNSRQRTDTTSLPSFRPHTEGPTATPLATEAGPSRTKDIRSNNWLGSSPGFTFDIDSAFMDLSDNLDRTPGFSVTGLSLDSDPDQAFGGALNLFPLLETEGHIDLAHYF